MGDLRLESDPRILIVDDQKEIGDMVKQILQDEGDYRNVKSVTSAEEALRICEHEKQDIVITDIIMPDINGISLLKELKKFHDTSGIVLSADETFWQEAIRSKPIEDYLLKPVDPEELLYSVRTILENKLDIDRYTERLNDLVEQRTAESKLNEELSIKSLALYAEYSDPITGSHLERMRAYTETLANGLKRCADFSKYLLSKPNYIYEVGLASILHDVGKMKIPDMILNKPGKLDKDEFDIMKTHTGIGANFLNKVNEAFQKKMKKDSHIALARDIAHYHHERWDGNGYPKGLKEDEIPLSARIVAVCDVYDALRSKRPYKDPWNHEASMTEIASLSGKLFDPSIINCLECMEDTFETIFYESELRKDELWQ